MTRSARRLAAAALCAVIAAVYASIGVGVVHVGEQVDGGGDMAVFGFGAAAVFSLGAVLLLRVDRRPLWAVGAVLQVLIITMYLAVSGDREPAFEAVGIGLRVPQLLLLGLLVSLAMRPPPDAEGRSVVDPAAVDDVLAQHRLAVVGASDDRSNFGRTVVAELVAHGYDVVAVHPTATAVGEVPAYPSLDMVPGALDAVIVMVPRSSAADVVRDAVDLGVHRIWLFKGAGAGAVSDDAVDVARAAGATVVAGACPLMFLPPVTGVHRIHRGARHLSGSLAG